MTWTAWAHKRPDGRFRDVGWKHYVEMHGGNDPVVQVNAVEVTDENERTHWGWVDADATEPAWGLVWPSEAQFRCCFPYGVEAEAERGKGRVVFLKITEAAS